MDTSNITVDFWQEATNGIVLDFVTLAAAVSGSTRPKAHAAVVHWQRGRGGTVLIPVHGLVLMQSWIVV